MTDRVITFAEMADEAELAVQGTRALLQTRRELVAKGKWPKEQVERLAARLEVQDAIARDLRARTDRECFRSDLNPSSQQDIAP